MKIINTHLFTKNLFLGAFASALMATSAFASSTITLSSDKNNPTVWSDAMNWDNGVINGETSADMAYMTLAEGQTVGYLTIDSDFDASNILPSVAGEYHITVADGFTMGTGKPSNRLFFNNEKTQAHIYVDSGKWDANAGTAIVFGATSSQSVTFSKDTSIDAGGQEFKVRSSYYANANKVATLAGTVNTSNNFQVFGNSASGSSTTVVLSGSVNNAKSLQVTYYNLYNEQNVGSAMELTGTVNVVSANGESYVTGYGIGENSKATLLIKDGGVLNITNSSASGFVVNAASHEDSGVALELQAGGEMNLANNIAFYGNSLNTNRAVAVINGILNANQVILGGAKNTRVDVGSTAKITTKGNFNVGADNSTDNTKGAVLNINGGEHSIGNNFVVGYRDSNIYTGSTVNIAGGTTTVKGLYRNLGSSTTNISAGKLIVKGDIELATHSKFMVSGTGTFETEGALNIGHIGNDSETQIVINTSGNKIGTYIYLPETGKIQVGASNDWSNVDIYARGGATKLTLTAGTLKLNSILWANNKNKEFKLDVADGATLILNKITGEGETTEITYAGLGEVEGSSSLKILNFDEKKIFVIDAGTESEQLAFLNRVALDGQNKENLHFQYDATVGGYWLSNIAVPEPAEWAMIFGGIALALAIYRRRK
ncbi:MAG: hypothetical protein J6K91_08310 [Opitutales bacterium]|nr:hypothetical protein [Opitutales bacterium]